MWMRQNGAMLRPGQACWVLAQVDKPGLCVQIHMDDGSGRPRDIQLADPAGTRRWVARGQLVAFGTATWFRESHRAAALAAEAALQLAMARQAALELEQLQASRRAAAEASQAETEALKAELLQKEQQLAEARAEVTKLKEQNRILATTSLRDVIKSVHPSGRARGQ